MSAASNNVVLYTYFRSSCSARIRTACHLKGIHLKYVYINLLASEQFSDEYSQTNPSRTVPTLVIPASSPLNSTGTDIVVTQSISILEFLEEFPSFSGCPKLLPEDTIARAKVRDLVNVIASDTQPPSNQHVLKRIAAIDGGDSKQWAVDLMTRGLRAFEGLLEKAGGGIYSLGDEVTLADVCLAPAVEGALRWGVDFGQLPRVKSVYDKISVLDAFVKGDWRNQGDTPLEFRQTHTGA